jgi:hypothetical protein
MSLPMLPALHARGKSPHPLEGGGSLPRHLWKALTGGKRRDTLALSYPAWCVLMRAAVSGTAMERPTCARGAAPQSRSRTPLADHPRRG